MKGIYYDFNRGQWRVTAYIAGKNHHVGFYNSPTEAVVALAYYKQNFKKLEAERVMPNKSERKAHREKALDALRNILDSDRYTIMKIHRNG